MICLKLIKFWLSQMMPCHWSVNRYLWWIDSLVIVMCWSQSCCLVSVKLYNSRLQMMIISSKQHSQFIYNNSLTAVFLANTPGLLTCVPTPDPYILHEVFVPLRNSAQDTHILRGPSEVKHSISGNLVVWVDMRLAGQGTAVDAAGHVELARTFARRMLSYNVRFSQESTNPDRGWG